MNEAHFEILGITVPSGEHMFHDDGYVSSIPEAKMKLNEGYGIDTSNYDVKADKNVAGTYCKRGLNHHIFYLRMHNRASDIHIRSHEETHALEGVGQLDALTDILFEEQNVRINLKEVDDEEIRADLGSLYALHARGLSPWRLWLAWRSNTFSTANKIYRQSRLPQRRFFIF